MILLGVSHAWLERSSFGVVLVLTLIALVGLFASEALHQGANPGARRLGRFLDVSTLPFVIAFAVVIVLRFGLVR
jgi:hypothetical protein